MKSTRTSRHSDRARSLLEERTWARLSSFSTLGALVCVSGVLLALSPWSTVPAGLSHSWWVTFVSFPEAIRTMEVLTGVAAVVALGALFPMVIRGVNRLFATGLSLMVFGAFVALTAWSLGFLSPPVTRVSIPLQETVESVPAIQTSGAVKLMLSQRLTVTELNPEAATATLRLARVGEEGTTHDLRAGNPVQLADHRLTLLGVEFDPRIPRVIVSSGEPDTIPALGMQGQSLQLKVGGPEFKIVRIARNYLGVMGAAVELEHEDYGRFWLYERGAKHGDALTVPAKLRLDRLESAPVAVLALSSDVGAEYFGAAGVIFLIGLGLLFASPLNTPLTTGHEEEE